MLLGLRIKNFAIVDDLTVDGEAGLNVITGETGAGKSILIGALSLVLGDRADKSMIRTGESQATVEAEFVLDDTSAIDAILTEAGAEPCEGNQLILRRIISGTAGRNFVNGNAATLQVLRRVGNHLVDMHGPHDHQSLLDPDFQMDILDAFGNLSAQRQAYITVYQQWQKLLGDRRALDGDDTAVAQQIDLYSFQVKEIEDAEVKEGEDEELSTEHAVIANAQGVLESAGRVCSALTDGDASLAETMANVQRELEGLHKIVPDAEEWAAEASSAAVQLRELSNTIAGYAQGLDADPQRLQWIEDRMAVYQKLKRKYGASTADVLTYLDETRARLHDLETRGERIAELDGEIAQVEAETRSLGAQLGAKRRDKAVALEKAITAELKDLGFPDGAFSVQLQETEPRPSGTDEIEFGFAPNVGEAMRALRAIASSGEISRVMLATKGVLAAHDAIPVLVFDEVDANIGGEMGHAIGRRLARIAESHQVLCITHLPQVAVHGGTHFAVTKSVRENRTFTDIRRLPAAERIEEVARMLGGGGASREHARDMLVKAARG